MSSAALRRGGFVLAGILLMLGGWLIATPVAPVGAAGNTWTVNNLGDTGTTTCAANAGAVGATCQLRDAIGKAGNGDTIDFSMTGTITEGSTLTLTTNVTITGPTIGRAVVVDGGGNVQVFVVNTGVTAAISNLTIQHGNSSSGGGIHNQGALTVTNSTFLGNAATNGGAILNDQGTVTLTVTNSTFSGNSASNTGGGIFSFGTLTVTNSTFSGNSASIGGGIFNNGITMLTNTLVANSTTGGDLSSNAFSGGSHNLIDDAATRTGFNDGQNGNIVGHPALLGTLGAYGSTNGTQTFPLLPGSPAIDHGTATGTPTADQRGVARIGSAPDIGAFESQGFALSKTSGDNQSKPISGTFAALVVTVAPSTAGTADNEPVDGGMVIFAGPGSGADIAPDPQTATIAGGQASITPTANGTPGGPYTVMAAVATGTLPSSVSFSLKNTTTATKLVLTQPPPGSATAGVAFPVQVTAEDGSGNIDTAYAGQITLAPSVVDTSATGLGPVTPTGGVASFTVTLTKATAGQTLAATGSVNNLTSGASAPFAVVAAAPATIIGAPPSESATVNGTFGALTATVTDTYGNPVNGVTVTLAAATAASGATLGGGTLSQATNASGVATFADLTANTKAGAYTVATTVPSVGTPASFTLTNMPGPAASLAPIPATPQNVPVGTGITLSVTVTDSGGNTVVDGTPVTFTATTVGGATATLPNGGVATTSNGVASIIATANSTAGGPYSVTATSNGHTATFALTNTAGAAGSIVATAGTPQSATVNAPFGVALAALVTDANGNPIPGVAVTFTAPVSGASGAFAGGGNTVTAMTNAQGIATAPTFTANNTAGGPYTVNATVSGVGAPAAFALTNTAATLSAIAVSAPSAVGSPPTIKVGQTVQLTATGTYSDGSTRDLTHQVQWHSGDPSKVIVDANGVVTGAGTGGPVTITATQGGVTSQITVTVTAPLLVGVGPSPAPQGRPSGSTAGAPAQVPASAPPGR